MMSNLYHRSLLYSFVYSRKIQDNDMTDKKKKYQIKCYYLTRVTGGVRRLRLYTVLGEVIMSH
jgi:hypothetical protein